jgi:hypothetical protein
MGRAAYRERVAEAVRRTGRWRALCCGCCLFISSGLLAGCASRPVEEVVTTDATRSSALPAGAEPLALAPKLPVRDPDIEVAGDRIAEALVYLNTHRRDRREAALRALNQAETAINRAINVRSQDDQLRVALRGALKDLDAAERALQRGTPDATKQLADLNKNLDNLPLNP